MTELTHTDGIAYLDGGKLVVRDDDGVHVAEIGNNPSTVFGELGYAEITSTVTTTATTGTGADVDGLAITFTAPVGPVWLETKGIVASNTAGRQVNLWITDSSNNAVALGEASFVTTNGANFSYDVMARRRLSTLTPGQSYTYKVRLQISATGTASLFADATYPVYFVVRRA